MSADARVGTTTRCDTWPGVPRLDELVRDAVVGARAQLVATLTLVLVLATVCFAILVTAGQPAANEARVVAQIDSAGTRLIALSDMAALQGSCRRRPRSSGGSRT